MFRFFVSICTILFTFCMAEENFCSIPEEESLAEEILTQAPDSVLFSIGPKVYLKSEKIHATDRGIFVGEPGAFIPIPSLHSDCSGCYITCSRASSYWVCWNDECANYGNIWYSPSPYCPVCHKRGNSA